LLCPKCSGKTRVADVRPTGISKAKRRQRVCLNTSTCGARFVTVEVEEVRHKEELLKSVGLYRGTR